jgi:hypothetical protein
LGNCILIVHICTGKPRISTVLRGCFRVVAAIGWMRRSALDD